MDKSKMFLLEKIEKYENRVESFLDFVFSNANKNEMIECPCARCKTDICISREVAFDHLMVDELKVILIG